MGRPREHDESTRSALLKTAEDLVNRNGPDALSVRAVADAAETSTRAVYSVFGSKAGLLEALAIRLFDLLGAAVDDVALTDDPVADVISASLQAFRRMAVEHTSLYRLVFLRVVPEVALGPEFGEHAAATFAKLEALVARIPTDIADTPQTRRDRARVVHTMTEGLATMELRGVFGSAQAAEREWRLALGVVLSGLSVVEFRTQVSGRIPDPRRAGQ